MGATATIGELRIDGEWFCWTLEDTVRAQKIKHETAIPAGEYVVTLSQSARFGTVLPEVHDVPEFLGIRIHPGNSAADTSGCILVGKGRNGEKITDSREAFAGLMSRLQQVARNEMIVLRIHQPDSWPKWNDRVTVDLTSRPTALSPVVMTGPLASPVPPQSAAHPPAAPVLYTPPIARPVVVPGGGHEDGSRAATREGGRAWVTTLLSWVTGLGAGVTGFFQANWKIMALAAVFLCLVTIIYLVRSLLLDYLRLKYGADPGKLNVH